MKPIVSKIILALALVIATPVLAQAQQYNYGPEWGENLTMAEREKNVAMYSYFLDAYNNRDYDVALTYLPQLIANVPTAMVGTYVYSGNIYKIKIQESRTLSDKNKYTDSLMMMYDLRIKYFPDHARYNKAYTLRQKATDYLLFKPTDREGLREVFDEAIAENSDNLNKEVLDLINLYFKELTDDYTQELIEPEEYLAYYESLSDLVNKSTDPSVETARTTFDALFIQSKAGDCETIERIFQGRLAEAPDDTDLLAKAFNQLRGLSCYTPFFFEIGEKYFASNPQSATAMALVRGYENNGNDSKAIEYMRKAVEVETDPIAKGDLCVTIAGMELERNNAPRAAEFARNAMRYNPQNGYSYMFLAQAYAIGSSSCEGFDQFTVFWLAYDELQKARRIFVGNQEAIKKVDELMGLYRANFPPKDELFFRGLNAGDAYEVKCGWIRGNTTARERP